MHRVRIKFTHFDQLLDFRDRNLCSRRHHGIEVPRGLPIDEIAPAISLPRLDEGEVGPERPLHHVGAPVEVASLLAFGHNRADARRSEKRRDSRAPGPNALGKRSLRHQVKLYLALQDHLFKELVLADVSSNVPLDLPIGEQQSHAVAIDAGIIADGGQILHAFVSQRADQVLGHPTQPKPSYHDGGPVEDVLNGLLGAGDDLVHRQNCRSSFQV